MRDHKDGIGCPSNMMGGKCEAVRGHINMLECRRHDRDGHINNIVLCIHV